MSLIPQLPQEKKDREHLTLLAIFHFVLGGLSLAAIGFLFLHYQIMNAVMNNPEAWKNGKNVGPSPQEFFKIFLWFYRIFGGAAFLSLVLNVVSGSFLLKRKFRIFSLIVAGFNCIHVPLGTVLGVFTIIVLVRYSVRMSYQDAAG